MDENRISGTARNLGGKVEEGLGHVTGDLKTQAQGKLDQAAGAAQDFTVKPRTPRATRPRRSTSGCAPRSRPSRIRWRSPLSASAGCLAGCTGRSENELN